jgi:HEAT repeat protein
MMAVLGAGIAALIVLPKFRSHDSGQPVQSEPTQPTAAAPASPSAGISETTAPATTPPGTAPQAAVNPIHGVPSAGTPTTPAMQQVTRIPTLPGQGAIVVSGNEPDPDAAPRPLPVLEKNYLATTNQEERLDILMDIADTPSAESIKALARLFSAETDAELKIDLLDSLLAIEGFKDEKLDMLKLGVRAGLPIEVRQSAIDGLIDLDDPRVIPVFNGLLNDPNEEVREAAKDALEMLQPETPVKR